MKGSLPLFGTIQHISSAGTQHLSILSYDLDSDINKSYLVDLNELFQAKTQPRRERAVREETLEEKGLFSLSSSEHAYIITQTQVLRSSYAKESSFETFVSIAHTTKQAVLGIDTLLLIVTINGQDHLLVHALSDGAQKQNIGSFIPHILQKSKI